jgi:hypothetical protein
MKILSAKHYPNIPRTAINVVENPDDPEFVHLDSSSHPAENVNGCPHSRNGDGKEITTVPGCRVNWRTTEYMWSGDELYNIADDGTKTAKSEAEILVELKVRVGSSASSSNLSTLINATW